MGGSWSSTHRGSACRILSITFPTLEEQADDLRAVMDDAGIERATLFASAFTTGGVVLFATQAPERVDALFLWSPFAQSFRTTPEEDLIGYDGRSGEIEVAWADVLEHWGEGRSLGVFAPGLSNERLRRGWAMLERASASPAMVRAITEAETCADLTAILPLVEAPTVVVTHADSVLPPGASRYVAELIPNAEFRQLPPSSEAAGLSDWFESAIDEFVRLLTGHRHASGDPDRILATVLFTDIVDSTGHAARLGDQQWRLVHDRHHALVRSHVDGAGGELIATSGDGTLSVLAGPARALRCAQAISHDVDAMGIQVRAGIHTGECERTEDNLAGLAVHIGARVAAAAGPGEVWVSRTVRDLVAGSGSRPAGSWRSSSEGRAGAMGALLARRRPRCTRPGHGEASVPQAHGPSRRGRCSTRPSAAACDEPQLSSAAFGTGLPLPGHAPPRRPAVCRHREARCRRDPAKLPRRPGFRQRSTRS